MGMRTWRDRRTDRRPGSPNLWSAPGIALALLLVVSCRFPGSVQPTVKIGLVAPFEGRFRYVGYDVIYAVRLAIREANAGGGVGGYQIELIAYDDRADPATAFVQAQKLAADPDVVAVIGHFREQTTASAARLYADEDLPLVAPMVFAADITAPRRPVFRLGPPAEVYVDGLLDQLEQLGLHRVAVASGGGPLARQLLLVPPSPEKRVIASTSVTDPDWLAAVSAADVDAVFCDADPVTAAEAIVALRQSDWAGTMVGGPELAASDFAAIAGWAAEGAHFLTPWIAPQDVDPATGFVEAYTDVAGGLPPGPLSVAAYEAAWVLIEALDRHLTAGGEPSRSGMQNALAATDRQGLAGSISFGADQTWRSAPLYWREVDTVAQ